jgi:hypothetical protein
MKLSKKQYYKIDKNIEDVLYGIAYLGIFCILPIFLIALWEIYHNKIGTILIDNKK